jgi:chaperonin GroES
MNQQKELKMLKPLGNRIIIEFQEVEEISKGGIYLPQQQKELYDLCKVLAIGPGARTANGELIPMTVKVGDIICINPHSARIIKFNAEEEHIFVNEHDVIAIVKDDKQYKKRSK